MESSYLTTLPNLAPVGFPLLVCGLLLLHCLMGLLAANVAYRKGADLGIWMIWGAIGGTLSLVHALKLPKTSIEG